MKSKSFDIKDNSLGEHSLDKTSDFVGLYKSLAETKKIAEKRKSDGSSSIETPRNQPETPKRERSFNKKKGKTEQLDISHINIDGTSLNGTLTRPTARNDKVTSTPISNIKNQSAKVKSIMKNSMLADESLDNKSTISSKSPKKRNKSVSFMLEDNEEVVSKRTKSDESLKSAKKIEKEKQKLKEINKIKKLKKIKKAEKENNVVDSNMDTETNPIQDKKPIAGKKSKKLLADTLATPTSGDSENLVSEKKKKYNNKIKVMKTALNQETVEEANNQNDIKAGKPKKLKKKKQAAPNDAPKNDGEPISKSQKMNENPDITEDLENLSIGDNAHTLTGMLDEMAVVDKAKKQQLRKKFNKNKKPKGPKQDKKETETNNDGDEEVKEKEKWKKRKWNKDKKGDVDEESQSTTVIVENLPLDIMLNYRKLLTDHFVKYGLIKKIGIAEVYPSEESKPVFTTTITFYSDGAAQEALTEHNTHFEGSRIRVKKSLPATETTVVLHSYAELTDHAALSSLFHSAGKIRNIRHLIKGKKSMSTAFIEFDGPESVERAIKMAATVRLGKKKIHLVKFEPREKRVKYASQPDKKSKEEGNDVVETASDEDSEDSNE